MHGGPKNHQKMELCQKNDVFHKIHTVKTLFLLTSPLAIKCHIVRCNIEKTRVIYPLTEKKYEHFFMTEFFLKIKSSAMGPKTFFLPNLVNFICFGPFPLF